MRRLLYVVLLALPAAAETKIIGVETTAQQFVIHVSTDQPGNCIYRVSQGRVFNEPVNDVNEALFRGASSDLRPGSLIEKNTANESTHTFVAGTRTAQKALDNKWYSRSLQTNTPHWIGVKCGADAEISAVYSTNNQPLGNTWAAPYAYDAAAPFGYAWPTVDFNDRTKPYVDPVTGLLVKRLTGLDQAREDSAAPAPTQPALASFAVKAGEWLDPQNGAQLDSRAAVSTGHSPLFVALSPVSIDYSTARVTSWDPSTATEPISNISVRLTGSATGGPNNTVLCLTVNGTSCATDPQTVTLPARPGNVEYPNKKAANEARFGYFSEWIGARVVIPPATFDMATFNGTVAVAGKRVNWKSGNSFNVEAWTAGSHIALTASEGCMAGDYTIASVDSNTSLTLNSSAGNCSSAPYTAANFGVLISPAESAVLSIDAVHFTWDEHPAFSNQSSGASDYCNSTPVIDDMGVKGWVCFFPSTQGLMSGYFLPLALDTSRAAARQLWTQFVPPDPDPSINYSSSPQDQTLRSFIMTYSGGLPSDVSDPNSFYALAASSDSKKVSIIKGTYMPGGRSKCSDPAGYAGFAPLQDGAPQNCNILWTNITRASRGGTLTDRMAAFDPRFDPRFFTSVQLMAVRKGTLVIVAATYQDLLAWEVFVDAATGEVKTMWPSYANFPARWAGAHSFLDQGDQQFIPFVTQNLHGCANPGCGAYDVPVVAVNGAAGAGLPMNAAGSCGPLTDARIKELLNRGSGCDELTLRGMDACDSDPSPYERTDFPPCSWNPNFRGLKLTSSAPGAGQKIEVGDTAIDPSCGDGSEQCEQFLVVQLLGQNRIKVLRNFGLAHGPKLDSPKLSALKAHAPNFMLRFVAGLGGRDCEIWGNFITDHHGEHLRCDATYQPTTHSDHVGNTSVLPRYDEATNMLYYSVRTGSGTAFDQLDKPETSKAVTGVSFGGVPGAGYNAEALSDSHPSFRQTAAPPAERNWFLDVVRMGSFFQPLYSRAKVTRIAGDLYRIAEFRMYKFVNIKYRPLLVWSGRHNMLDVSGPKSSIAGDAADHWHYCYAYLAGECVANSTAGSLYMNVPAATADGSCLPLPVANTLCVTPASPDLDTVSQIGFAKPNTNGEYSRTLTMPFRPWFSSNMFANAHATPDGSGAIFTCDWCMGVRSDVWWAKIPPTPAPDKVNRADYVRRPIPVQGAPGAQVRVRFGYAENGSADALYCTTRREACATDATGMQPFLFLSEPQHFERCDTGCVVNIPAVPGRVVYYVVDRRVGATVTSEPARALAVN